MTAARGPAPFVDALVGPDGMADPAPDPWTAEHFADALAETSRDTTPRILLPEMPVPPTAAQIVADWTEPPVGSPSPVQPVVQAPPTAAPAPSRAPVPAPSRAAVPGTAPDPRARLREAVAAFGAPEWEAPAAGHLPPGVPHHGMVQIAAPPAARPAPRKPAAMPARPVATPQQRRPALQHYRPAATQKRKSRGGGFVVLFVILMFLVMSNAGRELLDVISDLLNR